MPINNRGVPEIEWKNSEEFHDWRKRYHNLFWGSPQGKLVFFDLMAELGHNKISSSNEEVALKNFAEKLLYWCGGGTINVKFPEPPIKLKEEENE